MYAKKRILLGFILAFAVITGIAGVILLIIFLNNTMNVYRIIVLASIIFAFVIALFMFIVVGLLVLSLIGKSSNKLVRKLAPKTLNTIFPLVISIGRLLDIDISLLQASYAEINNSLVKSNDKKFNPEDVLLLAPHCLQWSGCNRRITIDVKNCRRCGKCTVGGLLNLAEKYGVNLTIATGGTLARKKVEEYRPKAIVAIACERDLTSGIQDVNKIPVLGVVNERPNGPCFNTNVNLKSVEDGLKFFLKEG